jgi:hypothetical protein
MIIGDDEKTTLTLNSNDNIVNVKIDYNKINSGAMCGGTDYKVNITAPVVAVDANVIVDNSKIELYTINIGN